MLQAKQRSNTLPFEKMEQMNLYNTQGMDSNVPTTSYGSSYVPEALRTSTFIKNEAPSSSFQTYSSYPVSKRIILIGTFSIKILFMPKVYVRVEER